MNRAETGLSLEHVHYIAGCMRRKGFIGRGGGGAAPAEAHDVPVLVRESAGSSTGSEALAKWRRLTEERAGFPPFLLDGRESFFCSLGNGHFSQALNLFRAGAKCLWTGEAYCAAAGSALREAVDDGVASLVLSPEMPPADRRFMAEMLNRSHGRPWTVGDDGRVHIAESDRDLKDTSEQFVNISKVLDAEELSCLVRVKLGHELASDAQDHVADLGHVLE